MATIFETLSRNLKSGVQEVREGLPLAQKGFQSLTKDVGKAIYEERPYKQVSPQFLQKSLDMRIWILK
jgi:hypothetical protein